MFDGLRLGYCNKSNCWTEQKFYAIIQKFSNLYVNCSHAHSPSEELHYNWLHIANCYAARLKKNLYISRSSVSSFFIFPTPHFLLSMMIEKRSTITPCHKFSYI